VRKTILFTVLFSCCFLCYCHVKDSTLIKGKLKWDRENILDFPPTVKIINARNSMFTKELIVDSLGQFSTRLPKGKYSIVPSKSYHWQGEEIIRINAQKSSKKFVIKKHDSKVSLILKLKTLKEPHLIGSRGILFNFNNKSGKHIDSFMETYMDYYQVPGASLAVIKNSEIIFKNSYGVKNAKTNETVNQGTLFEAGSITKIVFAFAVMRLYEREEIDLDRPLYQYLPHTEINDDRYELITARHVLSHQTGISNWPKKDSNGQFKLNFTPGTRYGYSGKAYEYLKEVIESITSKTIDDILKEEVLAPLRIKNMYFKENEHIKKHGANGHKNNIPSDIFLTNRTMVSYTMQTTSESLAKFALALYNRKGLKKTTYEEMFKIHSTRTDGTKWGLGVRIQDSKDGITYGHSGSTNRGFISNLIFYDASGLGYVILTNSQMGGFLSLPLLNEYLILGKTNYR